MNRMNRITGLGLALLMLPVYVGAQSLAISPAAPHGGDTLAVQFTESFNCTAPTPGLQGQQGNVFTFESVLPAGIVNCAFIPFPMPTESRFSAELGPLAMGDYRLTWNTYRAQADGSRQFLWTVSKDFHVAAPSVVTGAAVATTPALRPTALLALAGALGAVALFRRRTVRIRSNR